MEGPWEIRQLNHVNPQEDKEPNQGGLVDAGAGHWYFFSHQGTGDWEGRAGVLLPVTWAEGWPIIGAVGKDGMGQMVWSGRKPINGFPLGELTRSDQFDEPELAPEWEWNYQPRHDRWSLAEKPGFLRLHAFPAARVGDFFSVGNVLTQRAIRAAESQVTAKFELRGMQDGDTAGLVHFAKSYCEVGISQSGGQRRLIYNNSGEIEVGPRVNGTEIWLRSSWNFAGQSQFAYSLDGVRFVDSGRPYKLTWGNYRGDRIGLFSVNDHQDGGTVDIDSFAYNTGR